MTDPKALENAHKIIEFETQDAEVVDEEERTIPDNLSESEAG
jgi:hypothetical protein